MEVGCKSADLRHGFRKLEGAESCQVALEPPQESQTKADPFCGDAPIHFELENRLSILGRQLDLRRGLALGKVGCEEQQTKQASDNISRLHGFAPAPLS
jgi:hypothetical protein